MAADAGARLWLTLGAVNGFFSVALGAFAAHGLKGRLSEQMLEVFDKGVDYQGFHALVKRIIEHPPVQRLLTVPFVPLAELRTHEQQFLPGVGVHVRVE